VLPLYKDYQHLVQKLLSGRKQTHTQRTDYSLWTTEVVGNYHNTV